MLGSDRGARVRLKWPNDIYVELSGRDTKKKVGGILVNTSFSGGNMDVVVGAFTVTPPPPSPRVVTAPVNTSGRLYRVRYQRFHPCACNIAVPTISAKSENQCRDASGAGPY